MDNATPFQQSCRDAVDAVLAEQGIASRYETHGAADPGAENCYLRTQFARGELTYDLYIYAEEAAVNIRQAWYAFERHDHADADSLVRAVAGFLRLCLEGENPAVASRRARR